jgi:hypothetical protein
MTVKSPSSPNSAAGVPTKSEMAASTWVFPIVTKADPAAAFRVKMPVAMLVGRLDKKRRPSGRTLFSKNVVRNAYTSVV